MFGCTAVSLGPMGNTVRLRVPAVLSAMVIVSLGWVAQAATTTFTDRAAFESSLPTGFFFNNFSGTPDAFNAPVASVTGTGGTPAVAYEITAPTAGLGVFPDAGFKAVGNWNAAQAVTVTFTTGNVVSAGGDIWLSDINGTRQAGSVTVDFNNGVSLAQIVVPSTTSGTFGFAGITTTDGPISTMTFQPAAGLYLNVSNLSVAAVPEPAMSGLMAIGVAGLGWLARRHRR